MRVQCTVMEDVRKIMLLLEIVKKLYCNVTEIMVKHNVT